MGPLDTLAVACIHAHVCIVTHTYVYMCIIFTHYREFFFLAPFETLAAPLSACILSYVYTYTLICTHIVYRQTMVPLMYTHLLSYVYTFTLICIHIYSHMYTHLLSYVYTFTLICTHIYAHPYIYIHHMYSSQRGLGKFVWRLETLAALLAACIHEYVYTRICVYTYMCIHVYVYTRICVYTYMCIHVYVYIFTNICTYIRNMYAHYRAASANLLGA